MPYKYIDELQSEYRRKKIEIRRRLADFRAVQPKQYFYELLYCLMTPQTSAVNAAKAQKVFEEARLKETFSDPLPVLADKRHYIRFHKTKSKRILEMRDQYEEIHALLTSGLPAMEKREWLVHHVKGMSLKEATHVLRNIGMNEGLAILDRHILGNLKYHGIIRSIPIALTRKRYLSIEGKFMHFAQQISISTDELDLLFWSREAGKILK
ncbi:MAG: 8-oxoguanine DNA glycosylase [Bacteroidota bacterium]